ncbi:MAG: hypothetical protein AB7O13_03635 [Alphaproteobacteria bacterium]
MLKSVGLRPVPFLPSLLQEADLGCDVAFDRPGRPLLLQFKLGEALERFVRINKLKPRPPLAKQFWRFNVDTAEQNGQFDVLLKSELGGAEVYYVAPRFTGWDSYVSAFEREQVLGRSLIMKPSEIDNKLAIEFEPDGWHRIVYDEGQVFVCSKPTRLEEHPVELLGQTIRDKIERHPVDIAYVLKDVYSSLNRQRDIRVPSEEDAGHLVRRPAPAPDLAPSATQVAQNRLARLNGFQARFASEEIAVFAALGVETWALGMQLIAVTLES